MELQYRLMHRARLTPWEQREIPQPLVRLVSGPEALRVGTALDLGCGSGRQAAFLASLGWQVHGVDISAAALHRARARTEAVSWHLAGIGDARMTRLVAQVEGQVSLVLDVGCLHGLSAPVRQAWATSVKAIAAPQAVLLVRAAPPATTRQIGPRGILGEDIARLLPGWRRSAQTEPHWYELRASATS